MEECNRPDSSHMRVSSTSCSLQCYRVGKVIISHKCIQYLYLIINKFGFKILKMPYSAVWPNNVSEKYGIKTIAYKLQKCHIHVIYNNFVDFLNEMP